MRYIDMVCRVRVMMTWRERDAIADHQNKFRRTMYELRKVERDLAEHRRLHRLFFFSGLRLLPRTAGLLIGFITLYPFAWLCGRGNDFGRHCVPTLMDCGDQWDALNKTADDRDALMARIERRILQLQRNANAQGNKSSDT